VRFFLLCLYPAIGFEKFEDFFVRSHTPPPFLKEWKRRLQHFRNITHEFRCFGYFPCTTQCTFVWILFAVSAYVLYSNPVPADLCVRAKAWVCGLSLAGIAGSNPAGAWMSVCCGCCVLSGRGLLDGPILGAREFYRMWLVWILSWSFDKEVALAKNGLLRHRGKKVKFLLWQFLCAWLTGYIMVSEILCPIVMFEIVKVVIGYIAGQCPLLGVFLL
jgi:hypothetical protein